MKASSKERFTISVITVSKLGKHLVKTEAGSGSRAQVLTLEDKGRSRGGALGARAPPSVTKKQSFS